MALSVIPKRINAKLWSDLALFRNNLFTLGQQEVEALHKIGEDAKERIIEVMIELFQFMLNKLRRFQRLVQLLHFPGICFLFSVERRAGIYEDICNQQ